MLKLSLLYVTSAPRMDSPASQTWLAGRDWDTEKQESSSLLAGRKPVASTVESDFMWSNWSCTCPWTHRFHIKIYLKYAYFKGIIHAFRIFVFPVIGIFWKSCRSNASTIASQWLHSVQYSNSYCWTAKIMLTFCTINNAARNTFVTKSLALFWILLSPV